MLSEPSSLWIRLLFNGGGTTQKSVSAFGLRNRGQQNESEGRKKGSSSHSVSSLANY